MAKITITPSKKEDKVTHKVELLIRFVGGQNVVLRAKSGVFVQIGWLKQLYRNERIKDDNGNYKKDENGKYLTKTVLANHYEITTPRLTGERFEAKKQLEIILTAINESALSTPVEQMTKEWLDEVIDRTRFPEKYEVKEEKPAFFATLDLFLNKHKLSEVRKKNFRVIYRALQRFELWNKTTLDLDTITQETLRDLEEFLRVENTFFQKDEQSNKWSCINEDYKAVYEAYPETRTPQARGQNTINDIFTKLRTFYLWCIDNGKTTNNPFRHYKIEECVYGTPYYTTIEERNQLYNADLSARPQLAIQRDIFVFQCLIGCRVGDLYRFTKANVINGAIEYIARKTRDNRAITVRVPLNAIAKEILERYADYGGDKLLPFISEQKYNIAIKEAFKLAGITRIVTVRNPTTGEEEQRPINEIASSHLARRCFVGNLYKQVKDPNLVGALSGHKQGSKAFTRYREIDEEMKQDLVKLLE